MAKITAEIFKKIGMEDFTEEEERAWKDWVNTIYDNYPNSLKKIIFEDYKIKFKKRAITVMLAPDFNNLPFYWHSDYSWSRLNFCSVFLSLKEIDSNLIQFISELIIECLKILDYNPENKAQKKEENLDIWCDYQGYLIDILEITSDEAQKEILFSYFSLNDAFPYENMDFSSGYNPFWNLMSRKGIDEKWKVRADEKMKKIILSELEKKSVPRVNYENAFSCYVSFINKHFFASDLYYSKKLFDSQIEFIFENARKINTKYELISNYNIPKIMKIFFEDEYKMLRYKLCCYMLSKSEEDLKIYCREGLNATKAMREEFTSLDKDLKMKLERAISDGEKRVLSAEESKRKNEKIREEIISKMKNE